MITATKNPSNQDNDNDNDNDNEFLQARNKLKNVSSSGVTAQEEEASSAVSNGANRQERTLAILTDAADVDDIIQYIKSKGFQIIATKYFELTTEDAVKFYEEHAKQNYYEKFVRWLSSSKLCALVLEKEDAIKDWRQLMGPTTYKKARKTSPDSIRALFGKETSQNTHGSDSDESASKEIHYLFGDMTATGAFATSEMTTGHQGREATENTGVPQQHEQEEKLSDAKEGLACNIIAVSDTAPLLDKQEDDVVPTKDSPLTQAVQATIVENQDKQKVSDSEIEQNSEADIVVSTEDSPSTQAAQATIVENQDKQAVSGSEIEQKSETDKQEDIIIPTEDSPSTQPVDATVIKNQDKQGTSESEIKQEDIIVPTEESPSTQSVHATVIENQDKQETSESEIKQEDIIVPTEESPSTQSVHATVIENQDKQETSESEIKQEEIVVPTEESPSIEAVHATVIENQDKQETSESEIKQEEIVVPTDESLSTQSVHATVIENQGKQEASELEIERKSEADEQEDIVVTTEDSPSFEAVDATVIENHDKQEASESEIKQKFEADKQVQNLNVKIGEARSTALDKVSNEIKRVDINNSSVDDEKNQGMVEPDVEIEANIVQKSQETEAKQQLEQPQVHNVIAVAATAVTTTVAAVATTVASGVTEVASAASTVVSAMLTSSEIDKDEDSTGIDSSATEEKHVAIEETPIVHDIIIPEPKSEEPLTNDILDINEAKAAHGVPNIITAADQETSNSDIDQNEIVSTISSDKSSPVDIESADNVTDQEGNSSRTSTSNDSSKVDVEEKDISKISTKKAARKSVVQSSNSRIRPPSINKGQYNIGKTASSDSVKKPVEGSDHKMRSSSRTTTASNSGGSVNSAGVTRIARLTAPIKKDVEQPQVKKPVTKVSKHLPRVATLAKPPTSSTKAEQDVKDSAANTTTEKTKKRLSTKSFISRLTAPTVASANKKATTETETPPPTRRTNTLKKRQSLNVKPTNSD